MRPVGRRLGYFGGDFGGHPCARHWGQGRHHDGRSRVLAAGELRLLLLSLIAAKPRHGYDLIQAVGHLSAGAHTPSPGVVYPALSALEDIGHIAPEGAGQSRKVFAIAPAGTAELADRSPQIDALKARLAGLPGLAPDQHGPIRRAMDNLKTVLGNSLTGFEAGREQEIAALIDEAAQKIEQLG